MKNGKKILLLFTMLLCLVTLGLSVFTACNGKDGLGDETQYSVSVEYPDGTGVSGVTVTFSIGSKEYKSETTDEEGTATVTLNAGEYDITLSDIPEGFAYEGGAKTNRLGTPLSISLVEKKTLYTAIVSLPEGEKAEGVTVVWSKGDSVAAEVETDENGVASVELSSDTYSVTIKNEPDGYWLENALTVSEQSGSINITLQVDPRVKFTVTAKTEGGMCVRGVRISVIQGTNDVLNTTTDKEGSASFRLPADNYRLFVSASIPGLTLKGDSTFMVNEENSTVELEYSSAVIEDDPPANKIYVLGDIMYDFAFAPYDDTWTGEGDDAEPDHPLVLSDLLSDQDGDGEQDNTLIVLNFWYTTCSWCIKEFPCLIEAYEEYQDKGVQVIAIDSYPSDSATIITEFRKQYMGKFQFNFPVVIDYQLVENFLLMGYPTTVFIDRYGAVARIESGAITETEIWLELFEEFVSDDYTQTFTPGDEYSAPEDFVPDIPDVEMPASSEIEAAINNTQSGFGFAYYPETGTNDAEYAWPFVVAEKDGKSVIKPANSGYRSSYSMIHSNVALNAGDVLAFDFLSSCESSDILYVLIDGMVQWQIGGIDSDWDTCFAYVAIKSGTYKLTLLYLKDSTVNSGDDAVYITNMRITTVSAIDKTTDILRECATDMNEAETAYNDYITPVLGDDGYYHVETKNGPYVLADLFHATNWNNKTVYALYAEKTDAEQTFNYDLDGNGKKDCTALLVDYLNLANMSDCQGLVPVDATLKALLDAITEEYSENHHSREWLEICRYYSRYGANGEEYPLPILGLNANTAIEITEGIYTYHPTRVIYPINYLIYEFKPAQNGVYLFTSLATDIDDQTQAWLFDAEGIQHHFDLGAEIAYHGDDLLDSTADDDDGINFCIYAELTAGKTYYLRCAFYWNDDTTVGKSFDFKVEYEGTYKKVMTNAASSYFTTENEDMTGPVILDYVIETVEKDGKYYYKNEDGSAGSVIYIDVVNATRGNDQMSLLEMVNSSLYGKDHANVSPFDFTDEYYAGKLEDRYRIDYSETIKTLIAPPEDDPVYNDRGYIEATAALVEILKIYARAHMFGIEEAWLQFAYYEHEYGEKPAQNTTQEQTLYVESKENLSLN